MFLHIFPFWSKITYFGSDPRKLHKALNWELVVATNERKWTLNTFFFDLKLSRNFFLMNLGLQSFGCWSSCPDIYMLLLKKYWCFCPKKGHVSVYMSSWIKICLLLIPPRIQWVCEEKLTLNGSKTVLVLTMARFQTHCNMFNC